MHHIVVTMTIAFCDVDVTNSTRTEVRQFMVAAPSLSMPCRIRHSLVGTYDMDSAPSTKGFERSLCSREVIAEIPM
jgi:hypothetical protein